MSFKELPIMPDKSKGVMLFYPYVSKKSSSNLKKRLSGRWLGQEHPASPSQAGFYAPRARSGALPQQLLRGCGLSRP